MFNEGTSRTISMACVASAGVHALLYIALSTYGQRPIEPERMSAEVQLMLAPTEAQPPTIDTTPKPESVKVETPKPDVRPPEPPPPPPPSPAKDEPERVRLGNQNSPETETKTWLGSDKAEENQARKSSVEQGAYTQSPGLPGNPADTMGPESPAPSAAPSPSAAPADAPTSPNEAREPTDATRAPATPQAPPPPEAAPPNDGRPSTTAPEEGSNTAMDASDTSPAPPPPPPSGGAPPTPAASAPPPADPEGLLPPAPAGAPAAPAREFTALLTPNETSETNEINLEDLFSPATLTANAGATAKPPMTRERAIALLREAFAFSAFPRATLPAPATPPPTPRSASNPQPPGGGSTGDRPFEKSDRDVDPSSLDDPIDVKPGRPLAAKGLEIKTVPLDLTTLSRRFTWTTNPVVLVKFGRQGTVLHADFVKGQTAGSPEWNNALLSAMYRWTAAGEELKKLPRNNPEAGVEVQFRILLRD